MTKTDQITAVDIAYRHYAKTVTSQGISRPNNSRLKWYDIARNGQEIGVTVRDLAKEFIADQAAATGVPHQNELGFIFLHRCGEGFYFLMLCTWRDANELWKTVYYFDAEKMAKFAPFPQDEAHKGTFCVWEMRVVALEMHAWEQYLMSNRKIEDEESYMFSSAAITSGG